MIEGIDGLLGLLTGLLCGGVALFFIFRAAKKRRGLDERWKEISKQAFAASWGITTLGVMVVFALIAMGVLNRAMTVLMTLYLIHIVGWVLSMFYYSKKY